MGAISRAVADSRLWRSLRAYVKKRLAGMDAGLVRRWCFILIAAMLVWDAVLVMQAGDRSRASPHYEAIQPGVTAGEPPRRPAAKAFGLVWDSLMADPAFKKDWDSLLLVRPGLRDTVRELQRMDSAAR